MSCCSGQNTTALSDSDAVKAVNDAYSARALRSGEDAQREPIFTTPLVTSVLTFDSDSKAVAAAFGFTAEELSSVPAESNMGLSCGNPTAFAKLKEV
jgi:hypothetical protein